MNAQRPEENIRGNTLYLLALFLLSLTISLHLDLDWWEQNPTDPYISVSQHWSSKFIHPCLYFYIGSGNLKTVHCA